MTISRRQFVVGLSAASIISPFLIASETNAKRRIREQHVVKNLVFQHGVASGDPQADRVIIWTRISGSLNGNIEIKWEVSEDSEFTRIISHGLTQTNANKDFTVKIDATGLNPDTQYFYRFEALDTYSIVGRTRTLPLGNVSHLRFAVTSCSNYAEGYFNSYRHIAKQEDLNAVIHLGDYLYETSTGSHGEMPVPERVLQPAREIISLSDYRQRHAQYKFDPDLQLVHQNHPFIVIWDDHEIADNAWQDGADNHNPEQGEGDWLERKKAAMQAYFEWMPIRDSHVDGQAIIYRKFSYGKLLDLIMLDTRLTGRDPGDSGELNDVSRNLLGKNQEQWLLDSLNYSKQSNTHWRMIGQQVMFGQLTPFGQALNVDQWDGYPQSRNRLLRNMSSNQFDNTVFLTGDIHSSWANEVALNPYDSDQYSSESGKGCIAVEFIAPAITSKCLNNSVQASVVEQLVHSTNPHTKYVELSRQGYMIADITKERIQIDWHYTDTVYELSDIDFIGKSLQTRSGSNQITEI
jgi:alkaline phosphatase D